MTNNRRNRPQRVLGAVAAAFCVLLAGCASSNAASDADGGDPPLGPVTRVASDADIRLPLDAYTLDPAATARLQAAVDQFTADCMARLGFPGYPQLDYREFAQRPVHGNTFGLLTVEQAKERDGFLPSWARDDALTRQTSDVLAPWTAAPAVAAAANGRDRQGRPVANTGDGKAIPAGGCVSQGRRDLISAAEVPEYDAAWLTNLRGKAVSAAEADPRLSSPIGEWRTCIAERGYEFATPNEMRRAGKYAPHTKREAAIDYAACVEQSGYADTWVALTAAYEQDSLRVDRERIEQEWSYRQQLVRYVEQNDVGRLAGREASPPPKG